MQWLLSSTKIATACVFSYDWAKYFQRMFLLHSAIVPIFGRRCPKFDMVRRGDVLIDPVVRIQLLSMGQKRQSLRERSVLDAYIRIRMVGYSFRDDQLVGADVVDSRTSVWLKKMVLDIQLCHVFLTSRREFKKLVFVLYVSDATWCCHPTLNDCGWENCPSNGSVGTLFNFLLGRFSMDAGFVFVPSTMVLWTRHSIPRSDFRVVAIH